MRLGRFTYRQRPKDAATIGAILENGDGLQAMDLSRLGDARPDLGLPRTMNALILSGKSAIERCNEALYWAQREGEPEWVSPINELCWQLPLDVGNCVAAGRNFASHINEGKEFWQKEKSSEGVNQDIPSGFIKLPSVFVPDDTAVTRPAGIESFDYEVEIAAVLGSAPPTDTPPHKARNFVFGYTLFNDLTVREWARAEMKNQMIALGKNFPGAGPLGPWILTADEVPNPACLEISLSVNGELRQKSSCQDMVFSFDQLISHWSLMGLKAGDLITSGTPEGVAISRKPVPGPYFLKPGDLVEAHCPQIGTLRTRIV